MHQSKPKAQTLERSSSSCTSLCKLVRLKCLHLPPTITRNRDSQELTSLSLSSWFILASSRSPLCQHSFSLYNLYHPKCHASLWVCSSRCASIMNDPFDSSAVGLAHSWDCKPWDLRHFTDERSGRAAYSDTSREANAEETRLSAEQQG